MSIQGIHFRHLCYSGNMEKFGKVLLFFCCVSRILSKPISKNVTVPIKNKHLLPHDHIPGVKLERDGHINPDFHHEAFLGRLVDEGKLPLNNLDGSKKLIKIFHQVDVDNNHKVDEQELSDWIHKRIQEHYAHASKENNEKFNNVDIDKDGFLTLKEFVEGLTKGDTIEDNIINMKQSDEEIQGVMEEVLPDELARWKKADTNEDNKLTLQEFLTFQHPEHNQQSIRGMAEDLISQMDDNGDLKLSVNEFVRVPPGEVIDPDEKAADDKYFEERRAEFRNVIDVDKDGFVTAKELQRYLDPRHKQYAIKEANYLISVADENKDGELNEWEMVSNYRLFTGSSMAGNTQVIHEEF